MNQSRLLSFTIDNWSVLGDKICVSLVDRVAVLVGRNGAGKSAILEGFEAISALATGRFNQLRSHGIDSIPRILEVEIQTPTERRLEYRYELIVLQTSLEDSDLTELDESGDENSEDISLSWNERCQYLDGDREIIWQTEIGITTLLNSGNPIITILGNNNSLRQSHLPASSKLQLPQEMQWVYSVLRGVRFLGKIPARQTLRRRPSFLKVANKGISSSLADKLTRKIIQRIEKYPEELHELEQVCQRIGLGNKIAIQKFVLKEENSEQASNVAEEEISSVSIDGVNLGLLSDGTLRIFSILIEIIAPYPNATTIIEEPETQIHPLMLEKLLNELETYTFEDNLILSTHSPQVVAWTIPARINLVYREGGRTTLRKLQPEEIEKVVAYLNEDGDLGDWLYSGILDE